MAGDRWRVAGLAAPRSEWFSRLARWSTAAAIPVDFVKCLSASEVGSRLDSGEKFSALLIGADAGELSPALVAEAAAAGMAVIIVGGDSPRRPSELRASAALAEDFGRDDLIGALTAHAQATSADRDEAAADRGSLSVGWRGKIIAVTGSGGAGASLVAMALAQGLGSEASDRGLVLLADMALNADQAVMHDTRDTMSGLQELVEACHDGWLGRDRLAALLLEPAGRGYQLLPGLRRHRDWTAIRRRPLEAALAGLARTYRFVIADIDADTEGESDTGAAAVEDRNRLARAVTSLSDLVVVVGVGNTLGVHSLVRTVVGLADRGVSAERLLPVINRAARHTRRASAAKALSALLQKTAAEGIAAPIFVPHYRAVEPALRDGAALPSSLCRRIAAAVAARPNVR